MRARTLCVLNVRVVFGKEGKKHSLGHLVSSFESIASWLLIDYENTVRTDIFVRACDGSGEAREAFAWGFGVVV